MNDETKTSGPTATAAPEHRPADRRTDAGLGMFERVNNIIGTTSLGVASGVGGALEALNVRDDTGNISGTDETTGFADEDDRYWRENHGNRHYANPASNYEEYQPAYQYGTDAARRYPGRQWDDVQGDLATGWEKVRGDSSLAWENAKDAAHAAWDRVVRPGDHEDDGR